MRARRIYLRVQDTIYRKFFDSWVANPNPNPEPYMMKFRNLNMFTSLRVFCGEYIAEDAAEEISGKYWQITKALELVNFPFAFPGTKVWNACRAREVAVKHLSNAAAASKKAMAQGKEADCLLDAWVEQILSKKVREYTDKEMALVLLSFIFASQGASSSSSSSPSPLPSPLSPLLSLTSRLTRRPALADAMSSSITFAFQLLADNPAVLAKVREEQARVRAGDSESPMSLAWLEQMPYTNAVTKEVLRYRPPVIMVPYLTKKPFPINDEYTVPKGTMLIPSFWNVRPPLALSSRLSRRREGILADVEPAHSRSTTRPSTPSPTSSSPSGGCREASTPTAPTRRTGSSLAQERTSASVRRPVPALLVLGRAELTSPRPFLLILLLPSLPPPPSSPLGHRFAGQNYVYMHMSAVIGSAALFLNWEHEVTPLSEEIEIIATLFPKVRHEPTPSRRARAVKLTLPSLARRMAAGSSSASARSSTKLTSSSFLSLSRSRLFLFPSALSAAHPSLSFIPRARRGGPYIPLIIRHLVRFLSLDVSFTRARLFSSRPAPRCPSSIDKPGVARRWRGLYDEAAAAAGPGRRGDRVRFPALHHVCFRYSGPCRKRERIWDGETSRAAATCATAASDDVARASSSWSRRSPARARADLRVAP